LNPLFHDGTEQSYWHFRQTAGDFLLRAVHFKECLACLNAISNDQTRKSHKVPGHANETAAAGERIHILPSFE
jgi:hypothetical protein